MRRRAFLAVIGSGSVGLAGCVSAAPSPVTPPRASTASHTATRPEEKPGSIDNHRITAVEAISHDAFRRPTADGHEWTVTATLRVKPQDRDTGTVSPIGVFFVFFDAEGRRVYRVYQTIPANTGPHPRTARLSTVFQPTEAAAATFHRYRIDIVHP